MMVPKPTVDVTTGQVFSGDVEIPKPLSNGETLDRCEGPGFDFAAATA